jgi:uncharacterized protein YdeI (YjbR/CyaY-like superfamily)
MELYVKNRLEWREWLEKNHSTVGEVWLIYYKKPSGKPRIPYTDAVEEALCFGWIDGKIRRINDDYYIQRFTPRRSGSRWSKYNIERVKRMIILGQMKEPGLEVYQEALNKPDLIYENISDSDPVIPGDLLSALKDNILSYNNFLSFPVSARRLYIEWLNSAKKQETRPRRIDKIVKLSEKNLRPGML